MEDHKNYGIVLKRLYPSKQAIYLFDKEEGLITLSVKDRMLLQRLWPGMMLSYSFFEQRGSFFAGQLDILLTPSGSHYVALHRLHRFLDLTFLFLPKNIPQKNIYQILSSGVFFFMAEEYQLFIEIEPWLSVLLLQEAGRWHERLIDQISLFFQKLSILIDSFVQPEVECFYQWICAQNILYHTALEEWINESIAEQKYEQKR